MKGLWRNHLDAELYVIEPAVYALRADGYSTLSGDIWRAERRDPLLGTAHYIVTKQSLADAEYEHVEKEDSND